MTTPVDIDKLKELLADDAREQDCGVERLAAARAAMLEACRKAFFAGRGSKPPEPYDSESVEAAWIKQVDAALEGLAK